MPENVSRDDFAAQLNTKFRVFREPVWFECELIEVSKTKTAPRRESFSLLFLMLKDFPAEQGLYPFEHERIGATEIFVVPIAREPNGVVFEAIFSRITNQS